MDKLVLIDDPLPHVRRVTLNRPEKRNALSNPLRMQLFAALEEADNDPEVHVIVLRGAGSCFSAGYDLKGDNTQDLPFHTAGGLGHWPRHVVDGFLHMWDMATPIIAQVHGFCLAGGSELASACDLVYVAEDAAIGYPVVREISPPDNQFFPWLLGLRRSMEIMLTGDALTGQEAAEAGFANRAFPADELEAEVLKVAARIAKVPPDVSQINKRAVHRQMEAMGIRQGIRAGTEMQALAMHTPSARAFFQRISGEGSLTEALSDRDEKFGDYREGES